MSRIIEIEDLMELAAIDGDFNTPRVKAWQEATEAEIISFTGLDFNAKKDDEYEFSNEQLKDFFDVCKVLLQERVRENFLAPNYESKAIDTLRNRLSLIAEEILIK